MPFVSGGSEDNTCNEKYLRLCFYIYHIEKTINLFTVSDALLLGKQKAKIALKVWESWKFNAQQFESDSKDFKSCKEKLMVEGFFNQIKRT